MEKVSVNQEALKIVREILNNPSLFNVYVEKLGSGATIIDAGVEAKGGYLTGLKVTEICLGGLGKASLFEKNFGGLTLPTVHVLTDYPAIALLASQLAGWNIKTENFSAVGSGPARALSLKPKKLFKKLGYQDEADVAILVLETEKKPDEQVVEFIKEKCDVKPENIYFVLVSNKSITGLTQIAGRIVETGLYRLDFLGLDPLTVLHGTGSAPVMPTHPDPTKSMSRGNDSLSYGGETQYILNYSDEDKLRDIMEKAPSSTSKDYGKLFYEAYKAAGFDFYKLDVSLFAPASITVFNKANGKVYRAGKINPEAIKKSISFL